MREGALAELDVAPGRVRVAFDLAKLRRADRDHRFVHGQFDGVLDLVRKFGSFGGKKLDAIVFERIMRSADDHTGAGARGAREIGDSRCRHRPEQANVYTRRREACFQRALQQITGHTRVLADEHLGVVRPGLAQHLAGGPTELEHGLRGDRLLAHAAANAIGAEIFFAHTLSPVRG